MHRIITTFQFKRGKADTWNKLNPVLAEAEPGYELDTGKLKIGNGINAWSDLPYLEGEKEDQYIEIKISSFTNSLNKVEKGSIVQSITLSWDTNKVPTKLTLDGTVLDPSNKTISLTDLNITNNKTWTLIATDEIENTSQAKTTLSFCNKVFYGSSTIPNIYDSSFIDNLSDSTLSTNHPSVISGNCNENEYFYYCYPASYKAPSFTVGGFSGGFTKVATIEYINKYSYSETYNIYRSDNPNLGELKINITS